MAVTEQQIADHQLLTAPPKVSVRRSFSGTSTTRTTDWTVRIQEVQVHNVN